MFSLSELAARVDGQVSAQYEAIKITGLASIDSATQNDITFVSDKKYLKKLQHSRAGAVIVSDDASVPNHLACLIHPNPYLAYAILSELFAPISESLGIAENAVIHDTVKLGDDVIVEPNVSIGAGCVIGSGTVIKAGSNINERVELGRRCLIKSNVTLCSDTKIGDCTTIHSGAVIGSDGFGFANDKGHWVKIHQLGKVVIGSNVEIGANTCVDRGALDDTVIEDGVIIDNLVQIAHNVHIGQNTAIAAKTGIAGSASIGKHCTFGGASKVVGHISIADGTHIAGDTLISASIREAGAYAGSVPMDNLRNWRKNAVRFKQLDQLAKRIKKLENDV